MRAGQYRHRVVIEEPVQSADATGAVSTAWLQRAQVSAAVEPIGGREAIFGNQPLGEMDTRIRVRWTPMLARMTAAWRVRHGGRIYSIVRPPADKALGHREIELMCSTGVNAG